MRKLKSLRGRRQQKGVGEDEHEKRQMDAELLEFAKTGMASSPRILDGGQVPPLQPSCEVNYNGRHRSVETCRRTENKLSNANETQIPRVRSLGTKRAMKTPILDSDIIGISEEDHGTPSSHESFFQDELSPWRSSRAHCLTRAEFELSKSGTLHVPGFLLRVNGVKASPCSPGARISIESKTTDSSSRMLSFGSTQFRSEELVKLERVGRGASGVVHRAVHFSSFNMVALKCVPVFDDEKRAQLVSEINMLYQNLLPLENVGNEVENKSGSPYIVGMHNAFVNKEDTTINLVLEWMDGGSLQDFLDSRAGPLNEPEIAAILHCTFRGLKHLHDSRRLHRDIKPSNLLISKTSGLVKLSDFGISHSFGSFSAAKTFIGSLSYMAPERIEGNEDGYSYPADVWSLGLSAFTCAIGQYPFQQAYDEHGYWGLAAAIGESPSPILTPSSTRNPELCDLINKCLYKDPALRITVQEALKHPFLTEIYPYESVLLGAHHPPVFSGKFVAVAFWKELENLLSQLNLHLSKGGETSVQNIRAFAESLGMPCKDLSKLRNLVKSTLTNAKISF